MKKHRNRSARVVALVGALCSLLFASFGPSVPAARAGHTAPPASVNLAGSVESEATGGACGDWDPSCAASGFAAQPNGVFAFSSASIPAGTYEYKVALGGWAENYGSNYQQGGPNFALTLDAARTVRFFYDHKTHYIADSVDDTIYTVPGSFNSEIGCAGDWAPDCLASLMSDTDGDGTYTFVTDQIPAGSYEFKIATNESWNNPNYGVGGGSDNVTFSVPSSGAVVTISFNSANNTPSVSVASQAPSNDNNVEYDGLAHDSQSDVYRVPFGAVNPGTAITLRFRTFNDDVSGVRARFYDTATSSAFFRNMSLDASDISCYGGLPASKRCDFWSTTITPAQIGTIYYRFIVSDGSSTAFYADDRFKDGALGEATANEVDNSYVITVFDPAFKPIPWMQDAVIYQIFPDRFRNGNPANDPTGSEPRYRYPPEPADQIIKKAWSDMPEGYCRKYISPANACAEEPRGRDYFGGDLRGVVAKLGYLRALGVTVIYFNPIFDAGSNHAYDTQNYKKIDPFFGTQQDWKSLVNAASAQGIRIMLDGVFNHVSSDSTYFDRYGHFAEVGACEAVDSPYRSWFFFREQVGGPCAGPNGPNTMNYDAWFGFDSLPVLDKNNQSVRDLVYAAPGNVSQYWLKQGAASWRLDVMGDGSFPADFWREFRTAVKAAKPDSPIVGELWKKDEILPKIHGDQADTTMNYRFRNAILGYFGTVDDKGFADDGQSNQPPSLFARKIMSTREDYPDATFFTMMNIMDSHDTQRILWSLTPGERNREAREFNAANLAQGKQNLRMATVVQMTMPGAPTIYYGDEVAVNGDDDPDDRRTFPWSNAPGSGMAPYVHSPQAYFGATGDQSLLYHYRQLTRIRAANPVLRDGDLRFLLTNDDATRAMAYGRRGGNAAAIVAVNPGPDAQTLTIPTAGYLRDGIVFGNAMNAGHSASTAGGVLSISLGPRSAAIYIAQAGQDLTPGSVPADLTATAGNGQVTLAWSAAPDASGYNVYRSQLSGGGYQLVGASASTGYVDSAVENGEQYFYVVKALDAAGNESAASNEASATPSFPIGYAVLQWPMEVNHVRGIAPTETIYGQVYAGGLTDATGNEDKILAQVGFGAQGSDAAAWTSWSAMSFNVRAGNNYEYQGNLRPEELGTFDLLVRFSTDGGSTWSYGDQDGAYPGEPGTDMPGVLRVAASSDTTPPAAPANLRVTDWGAEFIALAWDATADAALYRVYRATAAGAFDLNDPLAEVDGATTTFRDDSVASGTRFYYVVRAFDAALNGSAASNEVSQVAEPKLVDVTFTVTAPATTPAGATVHIVGNIDQLGPWNPGLRPMTRVGTSDQWTITLQILEGVNLEYKYTLGTWEFVEKNGTCDEVDNRRLTVSYGASGEQAVNDTVANWRNVAPCGN